MAVLLLKTVLIITIDLLVLTVGTYSEDFGGQACTTSDWKKSKGICKPINECPDAYSLLRAGIQPNICSRAGRHITICCPTESRISEIMCDKYKEVYREEPPRSLLPYPFNKPAANFQGEIVCPEGNPLIFGGRNAKLDEFPHMAGLGWGNNPNSLTWKCGGTLISNEYVLTSAHCIESKHQRPNYVLLGDIYKDVPKEKRFQNHNRIVLKIKNYILHPNYKPPIIYDDLALLQLEYKVNLSTSIVPACLPQPKYRPELDTEMTTIGWGRTERRDALNVLQAVNLTRYPQKECVDLYEDNLQKPFRFAQGILRSQFCAGDRDNRKDSCDGDSGGPISVQNSTVTCIYYIVGITSFGPQQCGAQAGVYINVLSYLDWIEKIVWPN